MDRICKKDTVYDLVRTGMQCSVYLTKTTSSLAKSLNNMLHVALRLLTKAQGRNIDS